MQDTGIRYPRVRRRVRIRGWDGGMEEEHRSTERGKLAMAANKGEPLTPAIHGPAQGHRTLAS